MMGQIWRRLQLLVGQGRAALVAHKTVQVEVLDGEVLTSQRVEPYGLSYRPKPGAQAYLVFPAGDRAMGLALVVGDKRYQMELAEGEVALHDDEGNFVKLGRGGEVTVKASTKVMADVPLVQTTGDVVVGGALLVMGAATLQCGAAVTGALTNNGVDVGNGHSHPGVVPGLANTGVVG